MKTYYKDYDELARDWASGKITTSAHTDRNRMIAYGDEDGAFSPNHPVKGSIYSYGSHFCIARKWKAPDTGNVWFLVTLRSYSPTTQKHVSRVRNAIPSDRLVYLPQVDDLTEQGSDAVKRLAGKPINLLATDATEADLGGIVVAYEIESLDKAIATYLRSTRPLNPEWSVDRWIGNARKSVERFGHELPARYDALHDQCLAHYHARNARNAVLDATRPARQRLLAA